MAELTETTKYIQLNQRGTPVLIETNTNIIPIGIAHESGVNEGDLLENYGISRAQLHAALSYFYEYRETIREYEAETERLLKQHGSSSREKLEEIRNRKS